MYLRNERCLCSMVALSLTVSTEIGSVTMRVVSWRIAIKTA